jgi:hypothetical protein
MSVHSWKQPDSHGHNGTSSGQEHQPASPGNPRPWAVSAGGGRSRIRTWEGVADGFTGSPLQPVFTAADLRILQFVWARKPRSVRVASVVPECAWSARRIFWIMSHEVPLSPTACIIARSFPLPWRPSLVMKETACPASGGRGLACFRSRRTIGLLALSDARSGWLQWDRCLVTDQWPRSVPPGAALRAAQPTACA